MVVVRENGIERHVTALEAFLLQLAKRGVEGSGPAARAYMTLMEEAKNWRGPESPVTCVLVGFGFVHSMGPLRMARTIDPYRETARLVLEPWLVEAALARLDRVLSPAEQRIVVEATRTPHKVKWPEWWSERPQTN
jgi:hypothetical protein